MISYFMSSAFKSHDFMEHNVISISPAGDYVHSLQYLNDTCISVCLPDFLFGSSFTVNDSLIFFAICKRWK